MSVDEIAPASVPLAAPVLHSANAGVIVERVGQIRGEHRAHAFVVAGAQATHINTRHADLASVLLYEETFGTRDRLHWFINAKSLDCYEELQRATGASEEFQAIGGGSWETMFGDGTLRETVLLPQFMGMYGTSTKNGGDPPDRPAKFGTSAVLLPAQHQVDAPPERTLNSATAGVVIHRTGQLRYEFRGEGRQFARDVAAAINAKYDGDVTVFLYEEAFGSADRIHWLIHLRSLSTYYALIDGHAWVCEADRDLYTRQRVAAERGGGDWSRLFVEAGLVDCALSRVTG